MKIALFTALTLAAATAAADGITVANVENDVVVTLHGIHAINPQARAVGDRIEIDVADESPAQILLPGDQTVRKIEVSSGAHAHASLQVKHSAKTTELLARATKVSESGDDLVLVIPREAKFAQAKLAEAAAAPQPIVAAATVIAAPASIPTATIPAPATTAAAAPITTPTAPTAPTAPAPTAVAPPAATAAAIPGPASAATGPAQPPLELAASPHLPMGSIAVIVLFGAAGTGFFLWNKKRRGAAPQAKHTIDVLATRALGGKTRIVLIAVDDNELLLSVSDTGGARLLGSWPTNDEKPAEDDWRAATATPREDWRNATATPRLAEPLPTPVGIAPPRQTPAALSSAPRGTVDFGSVRSSSPSVSGILRLKLSAAGSGPHLATDDTAEDDNGDAGRDAAWVRELVNAARKGNQL